MPTPKITKGFADALARQRSPEAKSDLRKLDSDLSSLFSTVSFFPTTIPCTASETITAPAVVHLYYSGGVLYARNASNILPADYFARAIYVDSASTVSNDAIEAYLLGSIPLYTGLTPGATYYLSGTPGGITSTAPISGRVQKVGFAVSATELYFNPELV